MTSGGGGQQQHRAMQQQQTGQHSMGPNGNPAQNPGAQPQQQQDQMMTSAAPGGQPVPMGQAMTAGTFPPTILSSPLGTPGATAQYQYVMVNQQGQHVLQQANLSFPGMTAMPTAQAPQHPGQPQYIITTGLPQPAKQGSQQPQMMTSGGPGAPAGSQSVTKSMSQAPTYTISNGGIVSQPGAHAQPGTFMIAHQMGGSPTLQATAAPNMSMQSTSTSMQPSHIKPEPGKQLASAQQQQAQQVGQQQMQILPQGVTYVNTAQAAPGQAFMQNGQIFIRAPAPQDGQTTSQLMFSPQGQMIQTHPQTLQQGIPTQQLPQGLSTSMQPMTPMATSAGTVRAPVGYPTQPPAGKTQIARAPPTLLPATSSSTNLTNRLATTTASFMPQPSPKSKQKMSPRNSTGPQIKDVKGLNTATKSILQNFTNQHKQMGTSVSPPVLTASNASSLSMIAPGSPSAAGPPVLQTSLTAPPPQTSNSHSQPPLLQPMMMPTSGSNTTSSYVNGRPVTMATTLTTPGGFKGIDTNAKLPIRPNITKTIPAAPMEPISKISNAEPQSVSQNSVKPAQECLTHVIDGHVIHESSSPFPLEEDNKGELKSNNHIYPTLLLFWFNYLIGFLEYLCAMICIG